MNVEVMRTALHQSESGQVTFPQVVGMLAAEGVEGYYKDLVAHTVTYYLADGHTHTEPLTLPTATVPDKFSTDNLIAAIRAAQRDEIRYPVFIERAILAGTAAYRVCFTGRRAVYMSRRGELHIEEFPRAS